MVCCWVIILSCFFFFKQKTAYEMRISDWSSDVCSSDLYGYARVSTTGQDLAQQIAQLTDAGCVKIYREKISGANAERPQLKRAIGALDDGDVLMVTATDRLARNTRDLLNIQIGRAHV